MTRLQALICDLDGLLIDSEPLALRALEQLCTSYGVTLDPTLGAQLIGRRASDNAALVLARHALPLTPAELITAHRAQIAALVEQEVTLMAGAEPLLRLARVLELKLAIATSSPRSYLDMVLARFGWHTVFQATVSGEEVAAGKPAPDIFLRAAELLHTPPAACLVLEDAPPGVAAALAAGSQVWAVVHPLTEQLDFPDGVKRVQSLHAVIEWLKGAGNE